MVQENKNLVGLSCFLLVLYVIAASAGAFVSGLWAYAGIGGGIILFAAVWRKDRQPPWPESPLAIFTLIVLAIFGLENFQSSTSLVSWREWLKLITIFLPLLVFSSPRLGKRLLHPDFIPLMLIAVFAGTLTLSLELMLGGPLLHAVNGTQAPLTDYNRGLSLLVILAFPLMAGLMQGRFPLPPAKRLWIVIPFIIVLFIPAGLTESRASKLALLLGLVTVATAFLMPVLTRRVLVVLPFLGVAWPFAVQRFFLTHYDALTHFPDSWRARMEIWDYMSYRILERPFLGWGLGTAHLLPFQEPHGSQYVFMTMQASHPHNVMIELWVELGLPGLALGVAFALLMLRKAAHLDKKLAPFAMGAWMAALCLSLVAYDFWTDALFSAFALSGFVFIMLNEEGKNIPLPLREG